MALNERSKAYIRNGISLILEGLGEDLNREGLKETPHRVAEMYDKILDGLQSEPPKLTWFNEKCDNIVMVHNVPFYAFCEHHMALFFGHFAVGYLPNERVVGLSKLIRLFRYKTKRLTIQERLTSEIADFLQEELEPQGVMVHVCAEHTCMSLRGARSPGALTTTMAARGVFLKNDELRQQFMQEIRR